MAVSLIFAGSPRLAGWFEKESEVAHMKHKNIKKVLREAYGRIGKQGRSCCVPANSCCGSAPLADEISKKIGYTEEEVGAVPEGANLGLGCGNPLALAPLKEGQTVLDLGSGAGFDCFLAADKVGKKGKVIGVDMTPEMIGKARENAKKGGYGNVEFRLGEIEDLPVGDDSVDVVLSNCVINLSPDKERVFAEAFRVLKPGGRLMVSDIVLLTELPARIKDSIEAYIGCLSGATRKDEYVRAIREAGFHEVRIRSESSFPIECMANDPTAKAIIENTKTSSEELREIGDSVVSVSVYGLKPKEAA